MNKNFYLYRSDGRVALFGLATWLSNGYILRPDAKPKSDMQGRLVLYNTRDVIKNEIKASEKLALLKEQRRQRRNERAKERRKEVSTMIKANIQKWSDVFENDRLIIVDTETGGLNPSRNSLLNIAWAIVEKGKIVKEQEFYFDYDEREVEERALEVNGLDRGYILEKGAADRAYAMTCFWNDLGSCDTLIGHNINFDKSFIYQEFKRLGMSDKAQRLKDIHSWCTMKNVRRICCKNHIEHLKQWISLECLCNYCGVYSGNHHALEDVRAVVACIQAAAIKGLF